MLNQNENPSSSRRARLKNSRGLGLFVLLAVSAFLRLFNLASKPPHFDEGINGHFVTTIWRDGFYTYDPTNFHGPLYFYLCHISELLFGRSIDSFRVMNAVLAVLVVFTVYQFRRFHGRTATIAAWIVGLSPAFVFYGRYAIHETLFILGQLLFVYGRFAWMSRPTRQAIWSMASGVVILVSTKETFFIFLGTWIIAEVSIWFLERVEKAKSPWSTFNQLGAAEKRDIAASVGWISGISAVVLAALYTGFFERPSGLVDFFRAFTFWSKTGAGQTGHEKPFFYWIQLLLRYEWPLLIGLWIAAYATITLTWEDRKQRILLLTGFGTWLAYSLIPYKTPWLILSFWPLAFFVLPVFATRHRLSRSRWVLLTVGLVALLGVSAQKAWDISLVNPTDPNEPYVYVQTTNDYLAVMQVLRGKIAKSPEARNTSIVVMIKDPWPLPFDLSLYPKMRYARLEDLDKEASLMANAGMMLVDGSALPGLRKVFPKRFAKMKFQLRDAYDAGWALFDAELFAGALPEDVEYEGP